MNKVILLGRLTRDPEIYCGRGDSQSVVAKFSLAVPRRFKRDGDAECDFINCAAFGKQAEFAEKYLHKGTKMVIEGRIQTGSYTNRDGQRVYTTDIVVENMEFAESKAAASGNSGGCQQARQDSGRDIGDGFMSIPDNVDDSGLPFN